ncbi:MAG: phenylalanine--tRNA ligase subunit beta [Candidatus Omnitrophica bacterium]|nr:phenylalanine--tRNA ligase subunit beta [Candidatus Omnitrophota bacterium]
MKVTYNWLKDFADIKIPAAALAEKLTMAGLEVKSIEEKAGDFVLEIEITSNRPDWLSVVGVAREAAALTGRELKRSQSHKVTKSQGKDKFGIQIEDKKDCSVYTARVIRNVKVGSSPKWLKERLELIGLRSVNNVVDITNYVLFEVGEPLHAFDLDKLNGGKIIVRRAKDNESLVSIDAQVRKLSPDILVIADKDKPVAIAGVMGGKDTEVTEATKSVLLEAAIFNPVIVRRGRQKLGMNSDASYRFERGIDPQAVEAASLRASQLIAECCGGQEVCAEISGSFPEKTLKVDFSLGSVKKYLGIDIPVARVKDILTSLGFKIQAKTKTMLILDVPSWRLDVKAEIDLVEELARIYGFENIPSTLASVVLNSQKEKSRDHLGLIKDILVGLGLNEVITHSLIERKSLEGFWDRQEALIEVSNPLSLEQELMRPMLSFSLASRVAYNLRQQNPCTSIFEIAKTYQLASGKIKEKYSLALALCGTNSRWFGPKIGHVADEPGFLHLKGIIETLFIRLGLDIKKSNYRFIDNEQVEVILDKERVGIFRKLPGKILEALDIKHKDVFVAELDLEEKILPKVNLGKKFQLSLVPRYPGITRDITLPIKSEISLDDITQAIYGLEESLLAEAGFKDSYEGENVPVGFKRITISCKYCSDSRTLTEDEVAPAHERIVKALQEKFQIKTVD